MTALRSVLVLIFNLNSVCFNMPPKTSIYVCNIWKWLKVTNTMQNDQTVRICAYYHLQTPLQLLAGQVYQNFLAGHATTLYY